MIHIVICCSQERAEKYCKVNNLPIIETTIVMFSSELETYMFLANRKKEPLTVHNLANNLMYTIKDFKQIN